MKIIKDKGIKVAEKVISEAKKLEGGTCYQSGYLNGRESGFGLKNYDTQKKVLIAENRNSDDIVIYAMSLKLDGYSWGDDEPTERAYRSARYFRSGQFKEAGKYVAKKLK